MSVRIDRLGGKPTIRRSVGGTAAISVSKGPTGDTGPQGPAGPTGPAGAPGGSDAAFAGWVNDPASQTRASIAAGFATKAESGYPVTVPSVSDFRVTGTPSGALTLPTYDGSNVAVHPSVVYIPQGWNGYRYWMAMTPYPASNAELENPSILCSRDGNTWQVPAGVTNPLVASPAGAGYNSDPCLTLGPDDRLYMAFRDFANDVDRILVMSSGDGVTWTTPVAVVSTNALVQRLVSPALWYDYAAEQWVMLAVDIVPTTPVIKRLTCATATGTWSAPATVTVTPAWDSGRAPWHLDAKQVGDTVVALIQDGSSAGGNLYLARSADGGATLARSTVKLGAGAYKSTFVPVVTPEGAALDLYVAKLDGDVRRALATTDAVILKASAALAPYVLGDTYARADSATVPGNATSGQAYTVWAGTAGISSAQGYAAGNNNTKAVIAAVADGVFTLDHTVIGAQGWLVFRGTDTNNHWRVGYSDANTLSLQKVVAGGATTVASVNAGTSGVKASDRIGVVCNGTSLIATINGAPFGAATDSFNSSATFVGWQLTTNVARVKNLTARTL